MQQTALRFQVCIAATMFVLLGSCHAKADGGIIRLRETRGPFSITVFSSPEAGAGGFSDVSALIQERETGKVVLDADVSFTFSPPEHSAPDQSAELCGLPTAATRTSEGLNLPTSVRAMRGKASSKVLYSAPLELNTPGNWKLDVLVSRGPDTARFDCLLPVTASSGKLTGLLPYLVLPLLVIAVFALNQWLRRQSTGMLRFETL